MLRVQIASRNYNIECALVLHYISVTNYKRRSYFLENNENKRERARKVSSIADFIRFIVYLFLYDGC